MNERLLALATAQAKTNHLKDLDNAHGLVDGDTTYFDFEECPHPDCAAVRAGAALPPQPDLEFVNINAVANRLMDLLDRCTIYGQADALRDTAKTLVQMIDHLDSLPLLGAWRDRERKEK